MVAKLSALICTACALALGLPVEVARAGKPFVPSWIKNNPRAKSVTIELVADWNQHLRLAEVPSRTDVSDFNGYWGGGLTIIVPAGWSVTVELSNRAKSHPHSVMLTKSYPPSEIPLRLTEQDALWGAYTVPLQGIWPGETGAFDFIAREPGSYVLACARYLHFVADHWIGLDVKDSLSHAVAVVHTDKFVDYAGRP